MIEKIKVKFIKTNKNAMVPFRGTEGSAGYDLYACLEKDLEINFGDLIKIPTGIAIELPGADFAAFVFARSGLGIKYGIMPSNGVGVIDSDYRGEIQVGLCRVAKGDPYIIKNGDRVAQLIVMKVSCCSFEMVDRLSESFRGEKGFGSTGK